jgi:glycosyltransferase involved in cell wall biosynthesis
MSTSTPFWGGFMWVGVKVAQKSHNLQEGVQFTHPLLFLKLIMYSIIIPTLWVPSYFETTLESLVDHHLVDEILIIDNNSNNTPDYKVLTNKKIKLFPQEQNIYVNPAWNLGVEHSRNDRICLLNDDITFDLNVLIYLQDEIKLECGLFGIDMFSNTNSFNLVEIGERIFGFGCMMFMHKQSYYKIPDDLLVFYGDDYLFEMNKKMNKKNYLILGIDNNQVYGVTSESGVIDSPEDSVNNKTKHLKYFEGT